MPTHILHHFSDFSYRWLAYLLENKTLKWKCFVEIVTNLSSFILMKNTTWSWIYVSFFSLSKFIFTITTQVDKDDMLSGFKLVALAYSLFNFDKVTNSEELKVLRLLGNVFLSNNWGIFKVFRLLENAFLSNN